MYLVVHHGAGGMLTIPVVYLLSLLYISLFRLIAVCRGVFQRVVCTPKFAVCAVTSNPCLAEHNRRTPASTLSSIEHTLSTLCVLHRVRCAPLSTTMRTSGSTLSSLEQAAHIPEGTLCSVGTLRILRVALRAPFCFCTFRVLRRALCAPLSTLFMLKGPCPPLAHPVCFEQCSALCRSQSAQFKWHCAAADHSLRTP